MVSDGVFLKGVNDLVTALKLVDDTQTDIHETILSISEQLEEIANTLDKMEENLGALTGYMMEQSNDKHNDGR